VNEPDGAAVSEIARRDEVLELLFWMRGQGFGEALSARDLAAFLVYPEPEIATTLQTLASLGAVERRAGSFYALTEAGLPEARRRFVDDFREMLAEGHGECGFSCERDHEHENAPHPGLAPGEGAGEEEER
jgi:DNA-binding IclR family transcriptional regulator